MARPLRIEFDGAYYHVFFRGNNRFDIFKSKDDYLDCLDLLGELSERFSVLIYPYVLMGNHYHLLLQTQKSNLSRAMQWLGTAYTRRFNIRHRQTDHLFQGRFKRQYRKIHPQICFSMVKLKPGTFFDVLFLLKTIITFSIRN